MLDFNVPSDTQSPQDETHIQKPLTPIQTQVAKSQVCLILCHIGWSTSIFKTSCGCTALEDLKCCSFWDTTNRHKSKSFTPSIAWRREARKEEALDDLPWKDERRPSLVRRTLDPFQRQRWGNFWETWLSAYGLFRAQRYHLELNWTELNSVTTLKISHLFIYLSMHRNTVAQETS